MKLLSYLGMLVILALIGATNSQAQVINQIGGGCPLTVSSGPVSFASAPALIGYSVGGSNGNSLLFMGHTFRPDSDGILVGSIVPNASLPLSNGCTLYVEQQSAIVLEWFHANSGGVFFSDYYPYPPVPNMVGQHFRLQAIGYDPDAPIGLRMSNGLDLYVN